MQNIYHPDIYNFKKPVDSYWEETTKENFNLHKLTKDINSEVVVIGGGVVGAVVGSLLWGLLGYMICRKKKQQSIKLP